MVRVAPRGFAYLVLLAAIAMIGGVLAASATVWSQAQRRDREQHLLWVGEQYRRALLAYALYGDGSFPERLDQLLEDRRSPAPRRFLRSIYEDPLTGDADWVLLRDARGGITGLHSRSEQAPLKTGRFRHPFEGFEDAASYAEWVFSAMPAMPRPALPVAPTPPARAGPRRSTPAERATSAPTTSTTRPAAPPSGLPGSGADDTPPEVDGGVEEPGQTPRGK